MSLADSHPLLDALQESLRWEHAAITQFLLHGYRIGDLQTLATLEGIARQDMRHYKWLAEAIVKLGGEPTLDRAPLQTEAASPTIWLQADVAMAEEAIARYRMMADMAGESEHKQLFERLIDDEEEHRRRLLALVTYWRDKPEPVVPLEIDHLEGHADDDATRGFLDFAINHEYEVILQYLQHSFLLEDQYASRQLEEVAIEEMRHLGWLSEKMVDHGGCPFWNASRLEMTPDPVRMLELDQARELEVEADYQQMTAAMTDPEIRRLFDRIGAHEQYHAGLIGKLIERLKSQRQAQAGPAANATTVGSLLGHSQS